MYIPVKSSTYSVFTNLNKSIFNKSSTSWWPFIHFWSMVTNYPFVYLEIFLNGFICNIITLSLQLYCQNCYPFLYLANYSVLVRLSLWNFPDVLFSRNLFLFEQPLLCFIAHWLYYLPVNLQISTTLMDHKFPEAE